jgi:hypothetical protein
MKRTSFVPMMVALAAACARETPPAAQSAGTGQRTEVVLSAAAQQESQIETQPARAANEGQPIALDDGQAPPQRAAGVASLSTLRKTPRGAHARLGAC